VRTFLKPLQLLITVVVLAMAGATPAQAARPEYGYLWSLYFDFTNSFDGTLTIEVGPWQNGDLISVDATSTAVVDCQPVGDVFLAGGDAVFAGGYLDCTLDLAQVLATNHGLVVQSIDTYGSIVLRTNLLPMAQQVAPILSHPDASYSIDLTQTSSVILIQELNNTAGVQQIQFNGITYPNRYSYTYLYSCVWQGDCHGTLYAGPYQANTPLGGDRVSFSTAATNFQIGSSGSTRYYGRMGSLLIDPGNSVH
jgi:hypothetical protein